MAGMPSSLVPAAPAVSVEPIPKPALLAQPQPVVPPVVAGNAATPAALPPVSAPEGPLPSNYWGMVASNQSEPRMTQGMQSNPEILNRYLEAVTSGTGMTSPSAAQVPAPPPLPSGSPAQMQLKARNIVPADKGLSTSPGGTAYKTPAQKAVQDAKLQALLKARGEAQ